MTQDEFVTARSTDWAELDGLLSIVRSRSLRSIPPDALGRMAALYRVLAADLARAEGAHYAGDLITYLERLAARAHAAMYVAPPWRFRRIVNFVVTEFPVTLRAHRFWFGLAAALFGIPFVIGLVGALSSTAFAEAFVSSSQLSDAAHGYAQGFVNGRDNGEDTMMAGFYINNNIGIAFRCFATGIFYGIGSAFFLVYNGIVTGVVLGHVAHAGYGANIGSFVAGHSAWELTAIVIAGAAGLRMGHSLVRTDGRTRMGSLEHHAPAVLRLVGGAAGMLLVAALIEGFWSASSVPRWNKVIVGVLMVAFVTAYLTMSGRAGESAEAP